MSQAYVLQLLINLEIDYIILDVNIILSYSFLQRSIVHFYDTLHSGPPEVIKMSNIQIKQVINITIKSKIKSNGVSSDESPDNSFFSLKGQGGIL